MDLLVIEEGLIFWELIAFVLLLVVLRRFAWKPLLGILEARGNTIRESLEKAEQTRLEAERLMEDYKKDLEEARAEAQQIIDQGRQYGEKMKEEIVANARQEAEQVMTKAAEEIDRERDAAIADLRRNVADLTIKAASMVVNETLDKKSHQALIDQYLSEVGS